MHRRAFLLRLAALAAGSAAASGCASGGQMAVGIHPWPGYEPLLLARAFGWLPDGVRLREGQTAGDSVAALQAGELDAAALTLDEVLAVRASGIALTIVLVFDSSVGADMVMAQPSIRALADIAGRRVAVERGAVGEIVLQKLLEAAGLDEAAVTVLDIAPDRQLDAWRAGEIDVAIGYEPFSSLLGREGARRLFDSRQFPGLIFDVLAVRRDRLAVHRAQVEALLAGHFRALAHLRVNREDGLRRIAAWRGLSFDEAERSYAGLNLPDVAGNRSYLDTSGARGILRAARELNALMLRAGRIKVADDLVGLIDPGFLPHNGGVP
ncbi:MAG: ABC transporter substrate-binding protein [Thauera sp.]|nr:ABC transporter substrate-binding protein [Thauera sp.]